MVFAVVCSQVLSLELWNLLAHSKGLDTIAYYNVNGLYTIKCYSSLISPLQVPLIITIAKLGFFPTIGNKVCRREIFRSLCFYSGYWIYMDTFLNMRWLKVIFLKSFKYGSFINIFSCCYLREVSSTSML